MPASKVHEGSHFGRSERLSQEGIIVNAVTPPERLQSTVRDDEIDLVELVRALWGQRFLILAVTVLVGVMGLAYAMLATRHYSVQSVLRPAAIKDLDELNQLEVYRLSPLEALERVGAELDSYENRLNFFRQNEQLFAPLFRAGQSREQAFEEFNESAFKMLRPDPKKADGATPFVGIQLTYPEPLDGVQVVNQFVQHSLAAVRQQVDGDVQTLIGNRLAQLDKRIEAARANYDATKQIRIAKLREADSLKKAELEDELQALRQQLRTRRENRINQLNEAIRIATSLGITKPTTPSALGANEQVIQGSVIRTEVNNQQVPLYFMGTEALEAERKALSQRRSDDFTEPRIAEIRKALKLLEHNREIEMLNSRENEDLFLKGLAGWREEAAKLRAMKLDAEALKLVALDQAAVEPRKPVKPKRALIVALALVLGGMLGLFIAIVRQMLRPRTALHQVTGPAQ